MSNDLPAIIESPDEWTPPRSFEDAQLRLKAAFRVTLDYSLGDQALIRSTDESQHTGDTVDQNFVYQALIRSTDESQHTGDTVDQNLVYQAEVWYSDKGEDYRVAEGKFNGKDDYVLFENPDDPLDFSVRFVGEEARLLRLLGVYVRTDRRTPRSKYENLFEQDGDYIDAEK
jgi:hypothetical protein